MATNKIVKKAREYIGTPFQHQGRLKGVGVDCVGLVVCVAKELKLSDYDFLEYSRIPTGNMLEALLVTHLDKIPKSEARSGDIYLLRIDKEPQHLAIVSDKGIIHAYSGSGGVVEHSVNEKWHKRIIAAFRFRG